MNVPVVRKITGYCPHINDNHSIEAIYTVTYYSQSKTPHERCSGLKCEYMAVNKCHVPECPLEKIADSYNS